MERPHHHAHRHRHTARGMGLQHTGAATRASLVERSQNLMPRASCSSDSDAGCTKPTVVPKLAIVLAVVIPIVLALVVLVFLHRRNQRKLREEDANDKYKSMDFGVDLGSSSKRKPAPEMALADAEKTIRGGGHPKQMSMDMDVASPYILPAGLHGSRESFHSLSRNGDSHDPYRPVTFIKDSSSIRSASRSEHRAYRHDNGSMYTTSSGSTERKGMNDGLLKNASRMSQSVPPTAPPPEPKFPEPIAVPLGPMNGRPSRNDSLPPPPPPPPAPAAEPTEAPSAYVAYSPSLPSEPVAPSSKSDLPPVQEAKTPAKSSPSPPPRVQSLEAVVQGNPNTSSFISTSSYGDGFQVTPPSRRESNTEPTPLIAPQPRRQSGLIVEEHATNRLSMSLRPLPPDNPEDTAEQRANRIRSFYKEYFDDSKPEPAGTYNDYYEDYSSEYLDGAIFDPDSGAFVVTQPNAPYAEPVTRRAMTPPPRAPPRFRSNTGPRGPGPFSGRSSAASSGRFMPPPRGMSSMSGRLPQQPMKPRAPPTPLSSLPTPAKLTEDAFTINPADFAPPVSFRERQNGMRPDSPLGNARPYSPSVRPHTPLASSFDDLMVMPSPHALRKSGLFTGLDFAPPPRFRDPGSGASDAGSIRSNRSGMSAAGRMAIRNGANRVSRLPPGAVGTKDAMLQQLRPKMALTTPA